MLIILQQFRSEHLYTNGTPFTHLLQFDFYHIAYDRHDMFRPISIELLHTVMSWSDWDAYMWNTIWQ